MNPNTRFPSSKPRTETKRNLINYEEIDKEKELNDLCMTLTNMINNQANSQLYDMDNIDKLQTALDSIKLANCEQLVIASIKDNYKKHHQYIETWWDNNQRYNIMCNYINLVILQKEEMKQMQNEMNDENGNNKTNQTYNDPNDVYFI